MSNDIKIEKYKKYIKETHEKLGKLSYSDYWNLGYIDALRENKIINKEEVSELSNYNTEIYMDKKMEIIQRKIGTLKTKYPVEVIC